MVDDQWQLRSGERVGWSELGGQGPGGQDSVWRRTAPCRPFVGGLPCGWR